MATKNSNVFFSNNMLGDKYQYNNTIRKGDGQNISILPTSLAVNTRGELYVVNKIFDITLQSFQIIYWANGTWIILLECTNCILSICTDSINNIYYATKDGIYRANIIGTSTEMLQRKYNTSCKALGKLCQDQCNIIIHDCILYISEPNEHAIFKADLVGPWTKGKSNKRITKKEKHRFFPTKKRNVVKEIVMLFLCRNTRINKLPWELLDLICRITCM